MFGLDGLVKMGAILAYAGRGNASIEKEHIPGLFSCKEKAGLSAVQYPVLLSDASGYF